jgi:hypothetical protein
LLNQQRAQQGGSSSNARPSSAGATRPRSGVYGYNKAQQQQQQQQQTAIPNIYSNNNNYNNNQMPSQPTNAAGVYGQSYGMMNNNNNNNPTSSGSSQRPSSAGHQRPVPSTGGPVYSAQPVNPSLNINQLHISNPNPNQQQPQYGMPQQQQQQQQTQQQQSSSSSRPRSAGAIRRPYNDGGMPAQQPQQQQQQPTYQQQQQQQQNKVMTGPVYDQQYYPLANALGGAGGNGALNQQQQGGAPQQQRPLSANATSHTNAHYSSNPNYVTEQWNNPYKLQYGNNIKPIIPQQQQQVGGGPMSYQQQTQQQSQQQQRPSSSTAAGKLRHAVDLSQKLGDGGVPIGELTGLDNDDEGNGGFDDFVLGVEGGGDGLGGGGEEPVVNLTNNTAGAIVGNTKDLRKAIQQQQQQQQQNNDDDEMDGFKPVPSHIHHHHSGHHGVDISRSHPEVSTTIATPSASLELANGSSQLGTNHNASGALDVRNTSLDSFSEDNIQIGLTTLPNQFCTKRDALELRKLLLLSSGTRGGIVPSSSAVMDMYMVGKVVGVGSYGKVRAAWHRLTGSKIAIKTYDKAKMKDPAHWKRVHSEIKIMEQLSHPRIARMYEAVETPKRMHLIMECLDGGNLCSYVKAKRRLSEDESRRIFFQILQAIDYLHSLGVSHRDIKLENVLFVNDRDIKLIDFGFSTVCQPGKKLKVFCGTPSCKLLTLFFFLFV